MTAIETQAFALSGDRLELLKRTLGTDLTDDEFALFAEVCNRSGLDPFVRQIHAVKRGNRMTVQTGIDGYRLIADRTGKYAGSDDAEFEGTTKAQQKSVPKMARVTVWKLVGNLRVAFSASARWDEYYPGDGGVGQMWRKMPHVMLAKVAEALALRKAFPADLSGLYTAEEMEQSGQVIDVRSELPPAEPMASKHDVELLQACVEELEPDQRSEFLAWKSDQGFSWPWSVAAFNALEAKLEEIVGAGVPEEQGALGTTAAPAPTDSVGVGSSPPSEATTPNRLYRRSDPAPTLIDDDPGRPF